MPSRKPQGDIVGLLYGGLKTLAFTQVSCYGQDFAHLNLNVRKQMSRVSW